MAFLLVNLMDIRCFRSTGVVDLLRSEQDKKHFPFRIGVKWRFNLEKILSTREINIKIHQRLRPTTRWVKALYETLSRLFGIITQFWSIQNVSVQEAAPWFVLLADKFGAYRLLAKQIFKRSALIAALTEAGGFRELVQSKSAVGTRHVY